jgi:hypothetical protein
VQLARVTLNRFFKAKLRNPKFTGATEGVQLFIQTELLRNQSLTTLSLYLMIAKARGDEAAMRRIRAAINDIYRERLPSLRASIPLRRTRSTLKGKARRILAGASACFLSGEAARGYVAPALTFCQLHRNCK